MTCLNSKGCSDLDKHSQFTVIFWRFSLTEDVNTNFVFYIKLNIKK